MNDRYLELMVRLLIAKYGRQAVIGAMASAGEQNTDQLEEEIRTWGLSKKRRKEPVKPISDLIAEACRGKDDVALLVTQLVSQYENRVLLPRLSDVERFLERAGLGRRKLKSRRLALPAVVRALASQSKEELMKLVQLQATTGQSDYAVLARAIMGQPQTSSDAPSDSQGARPPKDGESSTKG